MKKELLNIFGNVYLTIDVDKENKWVYNDWAGYLTMDNVKTGATIYLDTVKASGFHCVLNDNSKVLGSWEHSLEWVKQEWEPMAVKYFALIVAQNSITENFAKTFETLIEAFEVKVCYQINEAERWLKLRLAQENK